MSSQRVRASVLHGERDIRIEDRALAAPASDEVQVAVHGTVVAVGSGVSDLAPGDRVALEVGLPCEKCEYCQQGRYNICREMKFRSSAKAFPHAQGTLQDRVNHPARWCHKLPGDLSLDLGAVIEPLSVAMHARDRANLPAGSSVLVFGAGAVGLLAAAVSKASDALAYAQDVAAKIKAVEVHGKPLGEVTAVYECTGVETCFQSSIYATKPGGKVMIIGMGTPILTLPMSAAALREVDLIGVFRYANTYPKAIKLLSNRPASMPDLSTLVTHRFKGLDSINDAFSMAAKVKDDDGRLVLKVVVDMKEDS
ncbi:hypothetical protein HIM_06345 [Hirsutella minnesotensis 3608]|uniref:Enoyl reductase (ER) domain-containing protein n=1 Tax=Hirsutella minnesotensis 3608 TaxID=1043627 RepID=A0A0F8A4X5_9HYPO|nr:hypothetical protein HIM_06345 [Hirsutella minnesotensis 3608]